MSRPLPGAVRARSGADRHALERHGRARVAAKTQAAPRACRRDPGIILEHEIDRAFERLRRAGGQRRGHVAVGVSGGGHERFLRRDLHGAVAGGRLAADRRPEVAARSGLAERQRRQVSSRGRGLEQRGRLAGRRGVAGDAAHVHQVDHRGGGASLRDHVEHRGDGSKTLALAAVLFRHVQAEQAARAERGDGIPGEGGVAIDGCCPRREIRVRDRSGLGHDPLLIFIETIHGVLRL